MLRIIGRAYEVRQPEPLRGQTPGSKLSNEAVVGDSDHLSTNWQFSRVGLKAGWYMLEVEHAADSIGCVLTLLPAKSDIVHLRLGSKKVCKRIVWFAGMVSQLAVSIDHPDCTINRLTLIALSSAFAMTRIRQRLENRGNLDSVVAQKADDVYNTYQNHLHDSIFNKPYRYVERDRETASVVKSVDDPTSAAVHLKLQRADYDHKPLCHSVEEAVDFAHNLGWAIDWLFDTEQKPECSNSVGKTVYFMTVRSGVKYRKDVMHQLLSAVGKLTVIVYADHDHVNEDGMHTDPILKPDWNPELLLNTNYVDLPWIYSAQWFDRVNADIPVGDGNEDALLLAAVLGIRISMDEGAGHRMEQVHEYSARAAQGTVAALSNDEVTHIPEILASRKMTNTAGDQDVTVQGIDRRRSVELALKRAGSRAIVSRGKIPCFSRISWPLPDELPAVDIIVPTRDKVDVLRKCLESVQAKTLYPNYRIVVVDNDSCEDDTEKYYGSLQTNERVTLLRYKQPFNYSAMNNFAVDQTSGPILILLNNDTEVISCRWLDELVGQVLRPEVGCVGAKLYYSNSRIQHAGVVVGIIGVAGHAFRFSHGDDNGYCGRLQASQNYTAVTAACMAVRRDTYRKAGGFDEEFLSVAWNDVDFCMKVQALGLRNVWTPYAELFHHEGLSRGADDTAVKIQRVHEERSIMMERWALKEFRDPAYHPLLTRDNENFGLGNTVTQPIDFGLPVVSG